jgi:hypothetical protein
LEAPFDRPSSEPHLNNGGVVDAVREREVGFDAINELNVTCERAMWASKLLTFQVMSISVLLAVITIRLAVEHPEWSPTGLRGVAEWKSTPRHQIDDFVKLLAVPN